MKVATTRAAMKALAARWRAQRLSVGFVPTMGALHEGHAALIRRAREENRRVVVSIFVNPTQFGPNEDYHRYPRAFPADKKLCARAGADAVYHPAADEVYPEGFGTFVEPPASLATALEGEFRPGHFRGVATVVLKLLETVRPRRAYFGEKDWQQLTIVRRLAADLDLEAEIVGCPTVREPDGLALSSRNAYLSADERRAAPRLHEALAESAAFAKSARSASDVEARAVHRLAQTLPGSKIDYVRLVDAAALTRPEALKGRLRLLAAVRLGRTRLIDNVPVSL